MNNVLNIVPRVPGGKKAARKLRHEGYIPGIIYGSNLAPVTFSVGLKELSQLCCHSTFFNHILEVEVDGKLEKVLPRDVVFDPVTESPVHVDFQRVSENSKLKVSVKIEFINEDKSPAMKKGGVLNVVIHQLECYCSPNNIPEKLTIDLTGKDIGDSFELVDIKLPEGVSPVHSERDAILATIVSSRTISDEDDDNNNDGVGTTATSESVEGTEAA